MKKRKVIILVSVIVLLAAAVWFYFWKGQKDTKIEWVTTKVEKGDIQNLITATGTVNAVKTVLVGTQVSGVISKVNVDFNDIVKKGQILAVLDTRTLQVSLSQANANLAKDQATLEQQQAELDREKTLLDKGLVTQSEYDLMLSNFKTAEATIRAAQGDISKANINLNLATIRSPIDGIVISRQVELGQTVAASLSTPTLFTIANDLSKMQLQANVDEADISQVNTGQPVFFKVDAYPDQSFDGTVQQMRLQPISTNNVVSYAVMIDAPNDDLKLLPGMNANISIIVKEIKGVIKIPVSALNFFPPKAYTEIDSIAVLHEKDSLASIGKSLVFVLNNGILTPVPISTGMSDGIKIEVKDGDIDTKSQLVVNVKQNGVTGAPQTKGLIQTPQRTNPRGGNTGRPQ